MNDYYFEYPMSEEKEMRRKELEDYKKSVADQDGIAGNLKSAHNCETETVLKYLDNDNKLPSGSYIVRNGISFSVTNQTENDLTVMMPEIKEHVSLADVKHAEEVAINEMSEPNSFRGMLDEAFGETDLVLRAGSPVTHEPPPIPNGNPHIADLVIQDLDKRSEKVADLVSQDIQEKKQMGIEKYGVPLQAGNGRNALVDAYQEALDLSQYLRQEIEEKKQLDHELRDHIFDLSVDLFYEVEEGSKAEKLAEELMERLEDLLEGSL
jgi:hypothetical protein